MENNRVTAVEWLISKLHLRLLTIESEPHGIVRETMLDNLLIDLEQAKEMEKEQIIDAFMGYETYSDENLELAEEYYNETYGLVCNCEAHTFYEWEKMENKCCQCKRPIYEQN